MEIAEAQKFLKTNHHAILATYRENGRPQMSPILVGVDDEGFAVVSTRETAFKTRNIRRYPRVSVCVFEDAFFGRWLQIDGTADVISLPDAMEPLVDYYRSVAGEHEDWDDYRSAMEQEQRVIVRIKIEQVGPDQHG